MATSGYWEVGMDELACGMKVRMLKPLAMRKCGGDRRNTVASAVNR